MVDDVTAEVYEVPLDEPESDGTLTWDRTTVIVARPSAGGVRGLGFTYGAAACAQVVHDELAPAVRGCDAVAPATAWWQMARAVRNVGRPGLVSMAMAAVDIGLWDLRARLLGVPLCTAIGAVRDEVPIYGSGGFTSMPVDRLQAQLAGWVDEGTPRVKMKVGTSWGRRERDDLARAAAAREAIGPGTELFVDANGGYARQQAARLAAAYVDLGVSWFEEPVSSDDLVGLAEIRRATPCEVAAGEYGWGLSYFERMTGAGAVDVLQVDVSRCGGITEWLRVAALAAARGLEVSGHCAPSLHLHPACCTPNLRHLEHFADHVRADHLLFDGVVDPVDGTLAPALDRPGIGLEVAARAARFLR
jgi:L-alanine-DL-glutamate epimerase-like enolase superfamily enzyme